MTEELCIKQNLGNAQYYLQHIEEDLNFAQYAENCIDECEKILKKNIREALVSFSDETVISFAETAIRIQKREHLSEEFVNYYF